MTRPRPTIREAYAKNRAAFILRTPFGVLLPSDQACLLKATARDAGVSVCEAVAAILHDLITQYTDQVRGMTSRQRAILGHLQSRIHELVFDAEREAAYHEAHRLGDIKTMKRLDLATAAWVLAVERAMGVA